MALRASSIVNRLSKATLWLLCIAVCACSKPIEQQALVPFYHMPQFTPLWMAENAPAADTIHTVAPFSLVNQDSQRISQETFRGKIYVANFFFTSCLGICPKMTTQLHSVAQQFASNAQVKFISHSVHPEKDGVAQLKAYAQEQGIATPQWHLVTGSRQAIYQLARQSYFVERQAGLSKDSTQFLHSEHCLLVDGKGRLRGIYNGTLALEMERLTEDIRLLLQHP